MRIRKVKWTRADGSVGIGYQADAGRDPFTSKRRRKTFPSRGEAKQWLEQGAKRPAKSAKGKTLSEIGALYVTDRKAAGRERSTYEKYDQHFKQHINKLAFKFEQGDPPEDERFDGVTFGAMRPSEMRPRHFMQLKAALVATRSHAMALRIWSTLTAALDHAVAAEVIGANVAGSIKIDRRPRETQEPVEIPSKAEIGAILEAAQPANGEPIFVGQAMITLTLTTGLRPSEMRALQWSRISIDAAPFLVKVAERVDQWMEVGAPKSASGYREIPLPESTAKLLREWKLKCPKSGELNLVFPNTAGSYQNLSNIHNRIWTPFQIAIGLCDPKLGDDGAQLVDKDGKPLFQSRYTWYALRHAYASMQIELGITPKKLQHWMGHASIQTTMDLYGHLWADHDGDSQNMVAMDVWLRSLPNQK